LGKKSPKALPNPFFVEINASPLPGKKGEQTPNRRNFAQSGQPGKV
jgi:hypothetical protein